MSNYSGTYFKLAITKNPMGGAFKPDQIYLMGVGINWYDPTYTPPNGISGDLQSYIQFGTDGKGSFVPSSTADTTNTGQYAAKLSDMPVDSAGNFYVLVPETNSGRIYFSIGRPLVTTIVPGIKDNKPQGSTIVPPGAFDNTTSSYFTSYDKIEFAYDTPNGPANKKYTGLWIDTTAVDFFFMPFSISSNYAQIPATTAGGTATIGTQTKGLAQSWQSVMNKFDNDLTGSNWPHLICSKGSSILRVVAPNKALDPANPSREFDTSYLDNYVQSVWDHYDVTKHASNYLTIDCTQLIGKSGVTTDGGPSGTGVTVTKNNGFLRGQVQSDGTFQFTSVKCSANGNQPVTDPITVIIPALPPSNSKPTPSVSNTIFGCGVVGIFEYATNKTVLGVVAKEICAGLNVGLLPLTGDPVLNKEYFVQHQPYYTNSLGTGENPWYNLYSKILHSFGDSIYAFAYDDAVGQDSTIYIPQPPQPADSSDPYPTATTLTIGDMTGAKIVDTDDDVAYEITMTPGQYGKGTYPYVAPNTPFEYPHSAKFQNVKSPFEIGYNLGKGMEKITIDLYLKTVTPTSAGKVAKVTTNGKKGTAQISLSGATEPDSPFPPNTPLSLNFYPGAQTNGCVLGTNGQSVSSLWNNPDIPKDGPALPYKATLDAQFKIKFDSGSGLVEYSFDLTQPDGQQVSPTLVGVKITTVPGQNNAANIYLPGGTLAKGTGSKGCS